MTGTLIVAAMETSLFTLQATRVLVMPYWPLSKDGKAARPLRIKEALEIEWAGHGR
jgi:hypothetical protein